MRLPPEKMPEALTNADVPLRYRNCRLDNFAVDTDILKNALSQTEQLAKSTIPRSLVLFGPPGRGKTHLAVAVLAEFLARGACGAFVSAISYALQVQKAFGDPSDIVAEYLELYSFLLIDDLGAEKTTESSARAMFFLIDKFYTRDRKLIITSNKTPKELYQDDPRVMSRLLEMCAVVELKGDDFRVRKAQELRDTQTPTVMAEQGRDAGPWPGPQRNHKREVTPEDIRPPHYEEQMKIVAKEKAAREAAAKEAPGLTACSAEFSDS
jgi:DNA replication protein DnaC